MARKPVLEGGTRDEIIKTATTMFLESGYDAVTVRNIQKKVGCEVGLFYYYFKSKDQLFDIILDEYTIGFRAGFEKAVRDSETPDDELISVFTYLHSILQSFSKSAPNLHSSVQHLVHKQLFYSAEEYIKNAIMKISGYSEEKATAAAVILAHGTGELLINTDENTLSDTLEGIVKNLSGTNETAQTQKSKRKDIEVYLL